MGADIGLEETCNLALCALVGHLSYQSLCKIYLPSWVLATWDPLLGYSPKKKNLARGWFGFRFKNPEETLLILDKLLVVNDSSLMIKC